MKSQMKKQASNPFKLASLLGLFRAVHWQHWTSHWASEGEGYYGDHQLFERLYDGMVDEIDGLAEKVVAKYGSNVVDTVTQTETMMAFLKRWAGMPGNLISKALVAEGDLLKALGNTVSSLKATQDISMGLEAHLSDLMDKHETNVYLLGQRAKGSVSRVATRHLQAAHKDARRVAYVVLKWMGVDDDEWDGWYAEWQDAEHDIVGHSELTYGGIELSNYVRKDLPKVLRILKSAFPGAKIIQRG
jgi:DNA-binding ferritin-like protein